MVLQTQIHVFIVEDDNLIRSSLHQLIDASKGFKVAGSFITAEEALGALDNITPDVLLLDIDLPGISGINAIPLFAQKQPDLNIVMLTVHEESQSIFSSLEKGAVGYLLKSNNPNLILEGIIEVYNGGAPMSPSIARQIITYFKPTSKNELSDREMEVLQKLCSGANNKKIAEDLFVSPNTIKAHIKNIYKKLHVTTRAEAVSKALKKRIL
ncbi:MAG: response regulator transcription factor [Flavobacteriaceae bacterium]|nr:response regulator transcription factor [Flavobacteriaceae bacterium]